MIGIFENNWIETLDEFEALTDEKLAKLGVPIGLVVKIKKEAELL